MKKIGTVLVAVAAVALVAGCGGSQVKETGSKFQAALKGAPDWVMKGCSAFSGEKKNWICGVGNMGGTNNLSLCRQMALARGRQEIGATLNLKVKALVRDYQQTLTGGEAYGKAADDEQLAKNVGEQVVNISLPGTRMEDSWISEDGNCFALAVLDMQAFKDSLQNLQSVDAKIKEYVTKNAEKAFQELDQKTAEPAN